MNTINDGAPAFPLSYVETNEHGVQFPFVHPGMSLRAWLAGKAAMGSAREQSFQPSSAGIAKRSVEIADAIIAELATAISPIRRGSASEFSEADFVVTTQGEVLKKRFEDVRIIVVDHLTGEIAS